MVSPDSDLYRAHPDWCLHIEGRRRTTARNQLVLDMSRGDVCLQTGKGKPPTASCSAPTACSTS
jgi:alpha-galactosidase